MGLFARRDLLPPDRAAQLEAEGFVVRHGNVSTTVRFENYRAPGRYSSLRKVRMRSALVVTRARLLVLARHLWVDMTFDDPRFDQLDLRTTDDALVIGFDPSLFDPKASGRMDVTCRIAEPERALEWIRAQRRAAR